MTLCAVPVFAGEWISASTTASAQSHTSFNNAWKDYGCLRVDGKYYDFTYGYDTWWTNEDYINDVYAQKDNSKTYYGKVRNSQSATDVTNKKSGTAKTGKADIKHTGKSVTYYIYAK